MPNPTVTNNDLGQVIRNGRAFKDEALYMAGAGPHTVKAGTILARDSVSLKLVPFVKGGSTNENGIPKAVIGYEATKAASGDIRVRACVDGDLDSGLLIIHADGTGANVDAKVLDQMRDYSLIALPATELQTLDNQ
jgi:hypothetical protein